MSQPPKTLVDYHDELATHPDPARRVGWRNAAEQRLRFQACIEALPDLARCTSILDVGCGLGHLAPVLRRAGFTGTYLGLDILPDMVEHARALHPDETFRCHDLAQSPLDEGPFDLVIACGTLSLRIPNYDRHFDRLTQAIWRHTRRAAALLVPSTRASRTALVDPNTFVLHDPARLRLRLSALTPWITLREDVLATELVAYLYRDASPTHAALLRDPTLPRHAIAGLLIDRGLPTAALETLDAAEEDDSAEHHLRCGQALRALGRTDEARAALERALERSPRLYAARLELESLK